MKEVNITKYKCETCGALYEYSRDAQTCESKPVTHDKGVVVGSVVRILSGDGAGSLAKVEQRYVIDKDWGHRHWHRYWHTVGINAKVIDGWGSRQLTFDEYEKAKEGDVT